MKKKVLYISVLAGALMTTSCDKMLDTVPQGQFTAEQLDENSVINLMASAYAGLNAHFIGNNEAFAGPSTNWIFDVRSDDAYKGGGATTMEENIHQLEVADITSDNVSGLDKWRNNYFAIARVHNALELMEQADPVRFASQIGEMKTLRAWFYFDLIRIFKRIPYFTNSADASTASNMQYSREEILDFIKQDLREAISVLPDKKSEKGRITATTAQAILAKVCAFTHDWAGVNENCDAIINSGQYKLYPHFSYISQIAHNNGSESIFALQCSTADGTSAGFCWSNMLNCTYSAGNLYGNGDDFYLASKNLVNAFRTNDNGLPYLDGTFNDVTVDENYDGNVDPRLDYTVGRIGHSWRGHQYTREWTRAYDVYGEHSNKKYWTNPDDGVWQNVPWGCSSLNFMFIRYADILLLKAEALIEMSHGDNALVDENLRESIKYINMVRQRAKDTLEAGDPLDLDIWTTNYAVEPYPTNEAESAGHDLLLSWNKNRATIALRMERRLELAMEGNRWFDLQRWGDDYLVKTMNDYMSSEASRHNREYYKGRTMNANKIFLLVPLEEIDKSNGLYVQY